MLSKGFSLLELMIGIAVAGILIALAAPALSNFTVKMRVEQKNKEGVKRVLNMIFAK